MKTPHELLISLNAALMELMPDIMNHSENVKRVEYDGCGGITIELEDGRYFALTVNHTFSPAEIVDEKPEEIIVKGYLGEMNFTTPNARALTQMDSFLQNHKTLEPSWDRAVRFLFRNDDGKGWEGVQKNEPALFFEAWGKALAFCGNAGCSWQEIANS